MKKKKITIIGCIVAVLLIFSVYLIWYQGKGEKEESEVSEAGHFINTEAPEEEDIDVEEDVRSRLVEREKGDIIWTISEDAAVDEACLKLFNQKLKKDGYSFQLKFQYLNEDYYDEEVREVLKNGDTDIALGGQNTDEQINVVSALCRDGLFLDLEPYLESDAGKALYEEYESVLWGSVTVDGTIYTIPNGIYDDGRYCVVFNNEYISEEEAEQFDGDITTLAEYLTDDTEKLIFTWDYSAIASVLGYYEKEGLFFDAEDGKVCFPYSESKVYDFYKMLNTLWEDGQVDDACSFVSTDSASADQIEEKIQNKEFSILLTQKNDLLNEIEDSVTIQELDFVPNFARNGGTNGICANSKNAEEAMQLLTLLHTDDEYAHLLLYGEEGTDYQIEDGRIVPSEVSNITEIDVLGIYRGSYPTDEDYVYTENIRQQKQEVYRSDYCKESAMSGFQINAEELTQDEISSGGTAFTYYDVWKEEDFEKSYAKAKESVEERESALAEKIQAQLDEWKKTVK
ncbi:MAG: hypothetical protein LUH14_03195 [Clostridiaceae bacterium]|nr:hypothetical protein [Clostridiaceae bacterium]